MPHCFVGQLPGCPVLYTDIVAKVQVRKFRTRRTNSNTHGHVPDILSLNIGSGILSIGRGPKPVQGNGEGCAPLPCSHLGPRPTLSMRELSLSMPEPMLSLIMLILATYDLHILLLTSALVRNPNQN